MNDNEDFNSLQKKPTSILKKKKISNKDNYKDIKQSSVDTFDGFNLQNNLQDNLKSIQFNEDIIFPSPRIKTSRTTIPRNTSLKRSSENIFIYDGNIQNRNEGNLLHNNYYNKNNSKNLNIEILPNESNKQNRTSMY